MSVNISLPYLGILAFLFVLAPLICTIVTLETNRHATRASLRKIELANLALNKRLVLHKDRERILEQREAAVQEREDREGTLEQRREALSRSKHDLCQAAHDMATQTKLAMYEHDTELSLPNWEDEG